MTIGRKSDYTPEIAEEICKRLELGGTIRSIEADPNMPTRRTLYDWLRQNPDFLKQYARAREESGHASADQVLDIAQDVISGNIPPDAGRVGIDALKWIAGKRKPKVYGDKLDVEHGGNVNVVIAR